jgi:hypothetical protein
MNMHASMETFSCVNGKGVAKHTPLRWRAFALSCGMRCICFSME